MVDIRGDGLGDKKRQISDRGRSTSVSQGEGVTDWSIEGVQGRGG